LPQTTINKDVNDLCQSVNALVLFNALVLADDGHFAHIM